MTIEKLVEVMAKPAHEAWMSYYRQMGYTSRKAEWGEEFLVPWEQLSERGKELDRIIMRAILQAFKERGFEIWRKDD
jgi:hypothetical protein